MSPRTLIVTMLALVFGGSAAVSVNSLVLKKNHAPSPKQETVSVVVAVTDIPRGGTIQAEQVRTRDFPKDVVPPGAITKVQDAVDRAVSIPLVRDEPVLESKLAPKGVGRGLAALVPTGMRAFTINTPNVVSSVAGFILPGNKVDVLLTIEAKRGSTSNGINSTNVTTTTITTTLLQNLEILAVDQKIDAPAENRVDPNQLRSVTLLVTPDQAAKLSLAQTKGTLALSLRNIKDDQPAIASPARLEELDGLQEEPAAPVVEAPKPPPPPKYVAVYRGVNVSMRMHPISGTRVRAEESEAAPVDSRRVSEPDAKADGSRRVTEWEADTSGPNYGFESLPRASRE